MNSRATAAKVLVRVLRDQQSLSQALPQLTGSLEAQEKALIQELCFGVCRWYHQLQLLVHRMVERPLKSKDTDVQALLLKHNRHTVHTYLVCDFID